MRIIRVSTHPTLISWITCEGKNFLAILFLFIIFIMRYSNIVFRFAEFSDGTTEAVFKSTPEMKDIDRGALCVLLRRRTDDYVRYVQTAMQVTDVFDEEETLSHLAWLTIGAPAARLYTDEDRSVSTLATTVTEPGVNDPGELPADCL